MSEKTLLMSDQSLSELVERVGTPFHIYDGDKIIENAKRMYDAFSWAPGFINFFAVKALPNLSIVRLLKEVGMGADCSSFPELLISNEAGLSGDKIMFSSNDTPDEEFKKAYELGAIINLDDITYIDSLQRALPTFPKTISFRFNPGKERTGNAIIGNPVEAKYGLRRDQIFDAYKRARSLGAEHFYLHTMVASNELNEDYIVETARMLFTLVGEIKEKTGISIEGVDLGGGVGIPYRVEDKAIDWYSLSGKIHALYRELIENKGLDRLRITFECGRAITGPYGYLVTKVRHVTSKYKDYVGLDASMADLMRPALYGAYHHITVLFKENLPKDHIYDVTGSLCENNDKFAIDRPLPKIDEGDILVLHDTGAHSHAMGFNYNGKMRHAEYLYLGGKVYKIRRDETFEDYTRTLVDMEEVK